METGVDLQAPDTVRRLQTALHAKAKGDPDFRFYTLSDKVWRQDVLTAAWRAVRRNGGACGVDGETFERIKERGVNRWLGELANELRENTYRPRAVRQVLIPKKQAGEFRPLGIPCIRDRVAQTAAMLVLSPIFEVDLQPEQYAYREGRSALDAVRHVHRLVNTGHREVVDGDLSNYFESTEARASLITPTFEYEFRASGRLKPFIVFGVGYTQYRDLIPRLASPHTEDSALVYKWEAQSGINLAGGMGVRMYLTKRLYVAPEVRIGLLPVLRTTVSVGYSFP